MRVLGLRAIRSRLIFSAASLMAVGAGVVGCKDDATAPVLVVAENTVLPASPTVVAAVANVPFNFPAGAGAISNQVAGQNLALTFGGTAAAPTANMVFTSATGAQTGSITTTVRFGSCIFAVVTSTFPAGHSLAQGQTVTVNPCNMTLNTAGAVANGVATSRSAALVLGSAASSGATVTVQVNAGGQLVMNGNSVGSVTLVPVSG